MRCTVPVPILSDLATFKIPTPSTPPSDLPKLPDLVFDCLCVRTHPHVQRSALRAGAVERVFRMAADDNEVHTEKEGVGHWNHGQVGTLLEALIIALYRREIGSAGVVGITETAVVHLAGPPDEELRLAPDDRFRR
jgi:hypothetical protein